MSDKQTASNWKQWVIGAVAGIAFIVVVCCLLIYLWKCHSPDVAKFAAYIIGGALVLGQTVVAFLRVAVANKTAEAMQQTADSTVKGNVAERFKNAVEHLGHESVSVRLGGVYALHHLAQEEENYRIRVFEILCAHIRQTTTDENYVIRPPTSYLPIAQPTVEIASILKLLFISQDRGVYEDLKANLQYANLGGAALSDSKLQRADLSGANLQWAFLTGAELNGARFMDANMANAFVQNSDMTDATLIYAVVSDVNFDNANLRNVSFFMADCRDSSFTSAQNLKAEQFKSVRSLHGAKLSDELKKEIQSKYPDILNRQPPKDG